MRARVGPDPAQPSYRRARAKSGQPGPRGPGPAKSGEGQPRPARGQSSNSFVLVRRPSLPSVPAQIDSILQIPGKETYFVVLFFLKTMLNNPFQQHPVLQVSLWSQNLGQLVIVKPQDIESHFTCLSFKWQGAKCQAVMSLSWVLFSIFETNRCLYAPQE